MMSKRVLFVVPPYTTTDALVSTLFPMPLAATTLAAVARENGWEPEIVDFLIPAQDHSTDIPASFKGRRAPPYRWHGQRPSAVHRWAAKNAKRFDVVAICAGQVNIWEGVAHTVDCFRRAGSKLVIGGAHVTTALDHTRSVLGPAVYVTGEGESILDYALTQAVSGDEVTSLAGEREDIEAHPLPAWDLVDLTAYPQANGKIRGVLAISRGCPWDCTFCAVATVAGRKVRRVSPERIKELLLQQYHAGARYICFLDDNLFLNSQAVGDVLGAIEELKTTEPGFSRVRFYCEEGIEVRVAAMPGVMKRIADAGFVDIGLGLETANLARAKAVRKPYTEEDVNAATAECAAAGIVPRMFYLVGLPGDTLGSVAQDVLRLGAMGVNVRPNNLHIYPGTRLHEEYLATGLIDGQYDWRMCSFHTPDTPDLDFRQVRRLKTYLGAVGVAASEFGILIGKDTLEEAAAKLAVRNRLLSASKDGPLQLTGKKLWRPTPYKRMLELLLVCNRDVVGVRVEDWLDGTLAATPADSPEDDVQAALIAAAHGREFIPIKPAQGTLL